MIPNTFVPSKKRTAKSKRDLLKKVKFSDTNLDAIIDCYEGLLMSDKIMVYNESEYGVRNLEYSKQELQAFCDRLLDYSKEYKRFLYTGLFLSALINKVIRKDDEIVLKLPETNIRVCHFGRDFSEGTLILDGNLGNWVAEYMRGGQLVVNGDIGHFTGHNMCGGELRAEKIAGLSVYYRGGKIYEDGRRKK